MELEFNFGLGGATHNIQSEDLKKYKTKKWSSRIEGPILSQKLGKDQKRSSRIEGPILSNKIT